MGKIKAAKSSKGGPVNEKELLQVKIVSRIQVVIGNFLTPKIKKENQSIGASHASVFNTLHASHSDTTKKLQENSKMNQGRSQGLVKHLLVIRRSTFKVVRALFHFKVHNMENNWYYIMNMWHSIQMPSTK